MCVPCIEGAWPTLGVPSRARETGVRVGTSTDVVGFGRVELVSRRAGGPKVNEGKDA